MQTNRILTVLVAMAALGLTACFDNTVNEPPTSSASAADTALNVFANLSGTAVNNATNVYAGVKVSPVDTIRNVHADTLNVASKPYAYVDLDNKAVLAATGDTSAWDLAFRTTTVRVRGQFAQVVGTNFDSVLTAPTLASGTPTAWYDYNSSTFVITPKAGLILVVKTSSGNYAKIEFLNYYKNSPAVPNGMADTSRFYTFRYVIAKGITNSLKPGTAIKTYYSLRTGAAVTDTSTGWDIALSGTGITVNGASQRVSSKFDSLKTAPENGYAAGTAAAWYNYAGAPTHLISPKADTTLVLKLADNKYAKIEIRSYYKGSPTVPNGLTDTSAYYTFRYVVQSNGSRDFTLSAPYTYFSLATGAVVADSSAAWDIAFRTTGVITKNGGQQITGTFDALVTAPETGYTAGALPSWYSYNSETHVVSPILGKVIVLKTADNKYAKVEIMSYYQGFPANPNSESVSRYYTFRYFKQADGSRNLQ
jgi:hypothetical protein